MRSPMDDLPKLFAAILGVNRAFVIAIFDRINLESNRLFDAMTVWIHLELNSPSPDYIKIAAELELDLEFVIAIASKINELEPMKDFDTSMFFDNTRIPDGKFMPSDQVIAEFNRVLSELKHVIEEFEKPDSEIREDAHDLALVVKRKNEPLVSFSDVKKRLIKDGLLKE